jgi:hypothetical protein
MEFLGVCPLDGVLQEWFHIEGPLEGFNRTESLGGVI